MQLTVIDSKQIKEMMLPDKVAGQYWVIRLKDDNQEEQLVGVEELNERWVIKSNSKYTLLDNYNRKMRQEYIKPRHIYKIQNNQTGEILILFVEQLTADMRSYVKWVLPTEGVAIIGRDESSTICYNNKYVSSVQARLTFYKEYCVVEDMDSTNGTFVNGKRIEKEEVYYGDVIYMMGLKLVISKEHVAINNPCGLVTCCNHFFEMYRPQTAAQHVEDNDIQIEWKDEEKYFYRSPRFKREIIQKEIQIDAPTNKVKRDDKPLVLAMGPSLTMGMSSAFTGIYTVSNILSKGGSVVDAMPNIVMSTSMLAGTVLWPLLTKRYVAKKQISEEQMRNERYLAYLEKLEEQFKHIEEEQRSILVENEVNVQTAIERIMQTTRNLWERSVEHDDFLRITLGIGSLPLNIKIKAPSKHFKVDQDVLEDKMYEMIDTPRILENIPVGLSLLEASICGVIGERPMVHQFLKSTLIQLSALHSYQEVKYMVLIDECENEELEFTKWLPHSWDDCKQIRYVANNVRDAKALSAVIETIILKRKEIIQKTLRVIPHYIIFVTSQKLAKQVEAINVLLKEQENLGISIVFAYEKLKDLPKECHMIAEFVQGEGRLYNRQDISGEILRFIPQTVTEEDVQAITYKLANTYLDIQKEGYELPKMLTFLEMFDALKVEHLNVRSRWSKNDPTQSLETPIGVTRTGELFNLDLHEKYHGAHGLVAGTTGSGKSEIIMTYILSLAVNYHPHEVAFILIDYKGGGMAKAFENLPHTVGIITNLDGSAINRSLVSIQSELSRRQKIFNETSKLMGVSNIDIYKYQKYYREGCVQEPLQHLFIISDEFAELKSQQPAFMSKLISAARIGRSLGIHLILATQKPTGVVDNQIWSNSKFKLCLKVQERSDSMEMLKRPDAAELVDTGRFYLQVGYNELFELGQSAWAGAAYSVSEQSDKDATSIEVVSGLGELIKRTQIQKQIKVDTNPAKEIDVVTQYLSAVAQEEAIIVKPLWLPEISPHITVDELSEKYDVRTTQDIEIVIGEYDDAANQRQEVLTLPLTKEGHVVVYGRQGSGKTTFVVSLMYAVMKHYTPAQLNLYVLDFGSETLGMFKGAPHVGDILYIYDKEKIENLFKMLTDSIKQRRKLFTKYGGSYTSYLRNSDEIIPAQIIIIHNYATFIETYSEYESMMGTLTREAEKYGIYFVLTTTTVSSVKARLLVNFRRLITLQMNDKYDYAAIVGNIGDMVPSAYKGRGMIRMDELYECQIAHVIKSTDEHEQMEWIRNYVREYGETWLGEGALSVPSMPEHVTSNYMQAFYELEGTLPVGVDKETITPVYWNLKKNVIQYLISEVDTSRVLQGFAELLSTKAETVVWDIKNKLTLNDNATYRCLQSLETIMEDYKIYYQEVVKRHKESKAAKEAGQVYEQPPMRYVLVNGFSELVEQMEAEDIITLQNMLAASQITYGICHIFCDDTAGYKKMRASVAHAKWFKTKVDLRDTMWVGPGIKEQYTITQWDLPQQSKVKIEESYGYIMQQNKGILVKVLTSYMSVEE